MNIAGHHITKNTKISVGLGTFVVVFVSVWTALGIGRPLFASDLQVIEKKIDFYQISTAIQILKIRKGALQTELRKAKRDLRRNPDDDDAVDDIDKIQRDLAECDAAILCHRTEGCEVIGDI